MMNDKFKKLIGCFWVLFLFLLFDNSSKANDGSFYASGNQLIPIQETSISLKKEILNFKKISENIVQVTVYYELFNPADEKEIIVGFEAESPSGDVDGTPVNGQHPYIHNFTVMANNVILPYKIALVKDSIYYKNGKINSYQLTKEDKQNLNENEVDFNYVYYFTMKFNKGTNIIQHTYTYRLSSSVVTNFELPYKLTTANRWANKQIDDFTVSFDMGDFTNYHFNNPFYLNINDMKIIGTGKITKSAVPNTSAEDSTTASPEFVIRKGTAQYHATNFSPQNEISLIQLRAYIFNLNRESSIFYTSYAIEEYNYKNTEYIAKLSSFEQKVLKNLPFARRGYVFKTKELQDYFSKQFWYMPDPNYEPDVAGLTDKEKRIISFIN